MIAQQWRLTPHLGHVKHVGALVDGGSPRRFVCVFVRRELVVFVAFRGDDPPHPQKHKQTHTFGVCMCVLESK